MAGEPTRTRGGTQAPGPTVRRSSLTLRKGAAAPTEESGDAAWGTWGACTEVIPVLMSLEEQLQTKALWSVGPRNRSHRPQSFLVAP